VKKHVILRYFDAKYYWPILNEKRAHLGPYHLIHANYLLFVVSTTWVELVESTAVVSFVLFSFVIFVPQAVIIVIDIQTAIILIVFILIDLILILIYTKYYYLATKYL